jgi:hypothetical protein
LLDDAGLQQWFGAKLRPQAVADELNSKKRKFSSEYDVIISEIDDGACVLRCKACSWRLSPSNPSQAVNRHTSRCLGKPLRRSPRHSGAASAATVAAELEADEEPGPKQARITKYFLQGQQHKQFIRYFTLFLITSETPFIRVKNKFLQLAMGIAGIKLPDEKQFRTKLLEDLYKEVKEDTEKELMELMSVSFEFVGLVCWFADGGLVGEDDGFVACCA